MTGWLQTLLGLFLATGLFVLSCWTLWLLQIWQTLTVGEKQTGAMLVYCVWMVFLLTANAVVWLP